MRILVLLASVATVRGDAGAEQGSAPLHTQQGLSCSVAAVGVDADRGSNVTVEVGGLPERAEVWCVLSLAWDGWLLSGGEERGHVLTLAAERSGPGRVACEVPPSPSAAEGPVNLRVAARRPGGADLPPCGAVALWYSARLVASFGESTYFGAGWGELLVRANASARGAARLRAVADGGQVLVDAPVGARGRRALNASFAGLGASFDGGVRVELLGADGAALAERRVRLRLVPERRRGSSAVDHKRRALLVDGRPFFPVGWFSLYLHFGEAATIRSLREMARDGVNSVMLYNLIAGPPGSEIFRGRGEAPPSPGPVLDAAQALGIKVQVYLLEITQPLSRGACEECWGALERAVRSWRGHPAVLGWYVADDSSGPMLPEVYRRIKALDPYHVVIMAIAGTGDAVRSKYLQGTDVIMVESYPKLVDYSYAQMNVVSRWPLEFMPSVVCGRAWTHWEDDGVISVPVFRSQLFHALIAGTTGELWFAYRNAENWNQPGLPLRAASFEAAGQLMELAPALTSPGGYGAGPEPSVTATAALVGGEAAPPNAVRARAFVEETGCVLLLLASNLNEPVLATVEFGHGARGIYDGETERAEALVPFELALPRRRVPVRRGVLAEYLPALGVQVFQLNGTSACAVAELPPGALEGSNLLHNPSFEQFGAYVAAPLYWDCSMTPLTSGSACIVDAGVRLDRRHSGRFVTGPDVAAFEIAPMIGWSADLPESGLYEGSVWAQADAPMSLLVGRGGGHFAETARMELAGAWRQLHFAVSLHKHRSRLVFKVNATGVLWLDAAHLALRQLV